MCYIKRSSTLYAEEDHIFEFVKESLLKNAYGVFHRA